MKLFVEITERSFDDVVVRRNLDVSFEGCTALVVSHFQPIIFDNSVRSTRDEARAGTWRPACGFLV